MMEFMYRELEINSKLTVVRLGSSGSSMGREVGGGAKIIGSRGGRGFSKGAVGGCR